MQPTNSHNKIHVHVNAGRPQQQPTLQHRCKYTMNKSTYIHVHVLRRLCVQYMYRRWLLQMHTHTKKTAHHTRQTPFNFYRTCIISNKKFTSRLKTRSCHHIHVRVASVIQSSLVPLSCPYCLHEFIFSLSHQTVNGRQNDGDVIITQIVLEAHAVGLGESNADVSAD